MYLGATPGLTHALPSVPFLLFFFSSEDIHLHISLELSGLHPTS